MATSTLTADGDTATFTYDDGDRVKGTVEVRRGSYGPVLVVNGREVGFIDLFTGPASPHPRLVIDHPTEDGAVLTVAFPPDLVRVEVDPEAFAPDTYVFGDDPAEDE